ncbi:Bacteriophage P2-related tail formation protein [Bordetella ansorpii]|uniref:Bacteriophage P2-related tail formation protein n=1 Tax=Bordetella ansorpii TaxID=288768 RepID=A0A157QP77_9BORD|nr:phage tail protein I [Bordetella ansorpii]SAI47480.1 Bacteriophage P2-related tail formation protein [Bordetella ansorpii]
MPDHPSLLPPGSTPLERKLATALADIQDVPNPIRTLRRAETCPAPLLTWLAWERSVDRWDDRWTEATKRQALSASFFVHTHKGTIGALRRVVEPLGYLLEVVEWWQMVPEGRRGTFRLTIGVLDTGIAEPMYAELDRLIQDAKRASQHLIGLQIAAEVRAAANYCVASYDGDVMTVYPYQPDDIEVFVTPLAALADHTTDTLTVYPS